eukprot:3715626-Prymnesium_polylepis.1
MLSSARHRAGALDFGTLPTGRAFGLAATAERAFSGRGWEEVLGRVVNLCQKTPTVRDLPSRSSHDHVLLRLSRVPRSNHG